MALAKPFLSLTAGFREQTERRLFPSICHLTVMGWAILMCPVPLLAYCVEKLVDSTISVKSDDLSPSNLLFLKGLVFAETLKCAAFGVFQHNRPKTAIADAQTWR